jgi:hypothetical protein
MDDQSPEQRFTHDVDVLRGTVNDLQSHARLTDVRNELAQLDNNTNGLLQAIADLRTRGYTFDKDLEQQATGLMQRWSRLRYGVQSQAQQQSSLLEAELRGVETHMMRLSSLTPGAPEGRYLLVQAQAEATSLQSKVDAVQRNLESQYGPFETELGKVRDQIALAAWTLAQVAEACFRLATLESPIQAVKATWLRSGKESKDNPKGVLFLTDQRLLFEQKQEIATKKVLFIVTEKQKVQKLLMEAVIGQVEAAKASKAGLLGHEDHIEFMLGSGAPVRMAHFHIEGQDSNAWQQLMGRAQSGELDRDRVAPDPAVAAATAAAAEIAHNLPAECPSCGAPVARTVLRGMDSVTCGSCGHVMRA